jgi:hypothetical protein
MAQELYMTSRTDMWEKADVSAIEECYGYDEAEHYQNNNVEEQVGSELSQNPQRRKRKGKVHKKSAQGSKAQRNMSMED